MDQSVNSSVLARRAARSPIAQRAIRSLSSVGTRWLQRNARDGNIIFDTGSLMVIAPHPDDESLGCGGTIARKTSQGLPVTVVVVTDGRNSHNSETIKPAELAELRAAELLDAAAALGVGPEDVRLLGFEDGHVPESYDDVVRQIGKLVREVAPNQLLIPSRQDAHRDHRTVHDAARAAVEAATEAGHLVDCQVLSYLIWFWKPEAWVDPDASVPRMCAQLLTRPVAFMRQIGRTRTVVAVDTDRFRTAKRAAVNAHRSQTSNITDEPGWRTIPADVCEDFISGQELYLTD